MPGKPPFFQQETSYSCVPACLRSILAYYGIEKTEDKLIAACKCSIEGTDVADVVSAARSLDFLGTSADYLDFDELRSLVLDRLFPIVWVRVREHPTVIKPPLHSVIVTKVGKNVAMINPASGPDYTLSEKAFRESWGRADCLTIVVRK